MLGVQEKHADAAEKWIKARGLIDKTKIPGYYYFTQRHLIYNYIEENELVLAELETRKFLRDSLTVFGKFPDVISRILLIYSKILYGQGRLEKAENMIKKAMSVRDSVKTQGVKKFESDMTFADFFRTLMDVSLKE